MSVPHPLCPSTARGGGLGFHFTPSHSASSPSMPSGPRQGQDRRCGLPPLPHQLLAHGFLSCGVCPANGEFRADDSSGSNSKKQRTGF